MPGADEIDPCSLRLSPRRRWLPGSPHQLLIEGQSTKASMTARSARLFKTGAVQGAQVGTSASHGYWIFDGHGFKAPLGAAIKDVAEAFDRHERARSNVPVVFDP